MSFHFRPAKRENVPLLIGVAGGTGSGKTMSGLLLARGLAGGQPFAAIDTENGRMSHYADLFPELRVTDLRPPFRPERYTEGIDAAIAYLEEQGIALANRVVFVDSMSHEWAGDGGCLDWESELTGGDDKKKAAAWAKVKPAHKRMVTHLTQTPAHVVLAFRSEPKIDIVRVDGRLEFVPKRTLPGGSLDGWLPITEKNMPYEMTASFLLMADAPGVPRPLKLEEQHRAFVPLDQPLSEETGKRLGEWARGESGGAGSVVAPQSDSVRDSVQAPPEKVITAAQRRRLFAIAKEHGIEDDTLRAVVKVETGTESTGEMTVPQYEAVVEKLQAGAAVEGAVS